MIKAQVSILQSDKLLMQFTEAESESIKKSVAAQVGAYFKHRFNHG